MRTPPLAIKSVVMQLMPRSTGLADVVARPPVIPDWGRVRGDGGLRSGDPNRSVVCEDYLLRVEREQAGHPRARWWQGLFVSEVERSHGERVGRPL